MKLTQLSKPLAVAVALFYASSAIAQTIKTWKGGNGDFFDPNNWEGGVPVAGEIAVINNGSTATIASDAGDRAFGTIRLGDVSGGTESGHVIMNGGFLKIGGTEGDPKAVIGFSATLSTFIMNGGTIWFDGPDSHPGSTSDDGLNGLDWEVGEGGLGRFEMHNEAKFFGGDDLKIAENAAGSGSCLIDGNARLSVGSGISISSGGETEQVMVIAGNALVEAGNSLGAGNPQGSTDEGYLTLAIGGGRANLTVQDNAVLNFRVLSSRQGITKFTVKNNGQVHIFDVLTGKGFIDNATPPDRPEVVGGFNSSLSSGPDTDSTLTLQDGAQMTVNASAGLGISGPRDGGSAQGGKALFTIRDRASFRVAQQLALGTGTQATTSDGTLEVIGPNASITIGGNLNMAVDPDGNVVGLDADGNPAPGKATLSAVITSATHTTVNVGGIARIANGRLKVKLDGYTPATGNVFTLIKGGTIEGKFAQTDFTEAPLAAGLNWEVEYAADAVLLKVAGQAAGPRTVTVTTINNVNPPAGSVSLLQALTDLQDGDVINFNIPGDGPHFIETPPGGYPLITKNNVTINGYSQPGSAPNTNPILAANNARIRIVLDSRNANSRLMDFAPTGPTDQTGYGDEESAVLGILQASNVTIRGISILAVPLTGPEANIALYGISFAKAASGHVNGCWIGVAPDGATIAGPADGITGFRYRVRDANNQVLEDILINNVVVGVKAGSTDPRAEFNVITGIPAIPIIVEGNGTRISGNFLNVFPDGLRDFNPPLVNPDLFTGTFEGNIEIGRGGNNTLIGTDGDGVNDADERNVLSGVLPESQGGYDHNIEFYGQNPGTNIVVAGNYIGVAVNGTTRFTNGVPVLNAAGGSAQFRFGSDFDGVSDALEANVCYNNWPTDLFPTTGQEGFFDELATGGTVGARGNVMVNNFPFPVSPLKTSGADPFNNAYYAKALQDVAAGVLPTLSTDTTLTKLVGTVPRANAEYPVTIIDLYAVDPEGVAYGQTANVPELPNGYVQGKAYIASFVEGSPADRNANPGAFDFDLTNIELKGALLTITANYSKAPAGTHNAVVLTSPFSAPVEVTFKPGSIESVGLTRVIADSIVGSPTADALGNWEPYTSVLGTSTFLIEGNTFADQTTDQQRYAVALQPVTGEAPKPGEAFFTDAGVAYKGPINLSRQNGNPGRVAGDKRPGAVNFITGGEASPHGFPEFTSDNRWTRNGIYSDVNRYGTVQTFSLDPMSLTQTPLSKAFDPVNGQNTAAFAGNAPEVSRFGGELAALDNGNFVVVIDDRSNMIVPRRTATAAIITPTGEIVKAGFAIDPEVENQIWSNVAAHKGGFCVRFNATLYFFDTAGNLLGKVAQTTSGLSFDGGRGDGTRIASHINSPYVFLAGKVTTENVVKVAVWDSRDRTFVTAADVSEGAFTGGFDRANLAVDALNRFVVSWVSQPAGYEMQQVAARVLAFNEGAKTVTALTKSFLPFVNAAPSGGIRTLQMSVSMTTKQILVAAKGEINLQNKPELGANSPREVNFYTIISHPDPKDDPTPPVGGSGEPLRIASITVQGANLTLNWTGGNGPFLVQFTPALGTAWQDLVTTSERTLTVPLAGNVGFLRVVDGTTKTVRLFTGILTPQQEVQTPAVESSASGVGFLSLEGDKATYYVSFAGLGSDAAAAHVHGRAPAGQNAGVFFHLLPSPSFPAGTRAGVLSGSATLTADQKAALEAGETYFNIHTATYGAGEIRGQVLPATFRVTLSGAAERPNPVNTTATGSGTFTLVGNQLSYNITYSGLSSAANAGHIHGPGTAEQAVGVLVPFPNVSGTSGTLTGTLTLDAAQLSALLGGLTYVNIHTGNNPGGEIRGQILP